MKAYFKGVSNSLTGYDHFQYSVGDVFTADTDDTWHWLYFTKRIDIAVSYGPRILLVEPITRIQNFGHGNLCAKSLRIIRELSAEEILMQLVLTPMSKKHASFCLHALGLSPKL